MKVLSDPELPGLALALDEGALLELLAARLPECRQGARLSAARAIDVQYQPGQAATILVRLKFHDGATSRTTRQLLCLRVLRASDAMPTCPPELLARYAARRQSKEGAREAPLETAWLPIQEHCLLVHAFPLDPGLPSLLDITDPDALATAFTQLWTPRGTRAKRVRVDTLAYTPESRAALAYDILCEDRETRVPHQRRLVGKLHVRRSPGRLFAGAWALWRRSKGRVNIAPPVGFIESMGLSLQEFIQGARLSDLAGTPAFLKPIRQSARAIAHVHAQHLPLHAERDVEKEGAVVRRWLSVLDGILPDRRAEIARLGERLLSELAQRFTARGAVHADFHLANVMVHRDTLTIVDWDQIAHGDPMLDVGRLLASLRVSALRTSQDPAGLSDAADAFLATYLEASGEDESRARLFEASALLIAAAAPFRLQREGWKEQADVLLDEAWRCLERSTPRASVGAPRLQAVEALPPLADRREWALDPTLSLALIGPLLRKAKNEPALDLVACKPRLRHASDEAFEVEYALQGFLAGQPITARALARGEAEHAGRGSQRRLEALRDALASAPGAPALPLPLGPATPLGLSVLEPLERGEDPFASVEGARAAGRALAALQAAAVAIDKERGLEKEILAARRRIEQLTLAPERAAELIEQLAEIERAALAHPVALAPSPRDVRPQDFTWDGARIGLVVIRDVALAPLPVAAGLLHGRLCAATSAGGSSKEAAAAFLAGWSHAAGLDAAALAPYLSLGHLRSTLRALKMTSEQN